MAKARNEPSAPRQAAPVDVYQIAADLFVKNCVPRTDSIQPWKVAADCFQAAIEFDRVASMISGGATPDDIGPAPKTEPAIEAEQPESPAASQ